MKISVVIITLNESLNILRCLNSVSKIADEIIVLDAFSSDTTPQICQQQPNVRFIQREWEGYSASKNYANSLAAFDYILSLDADEVLSPKLEQHILALKQAAHVDAVYQITRLTNYCGEWIRHCGWYPDNKIRLFPAKYCHWEGKFVHEKLCFPTHFKTILLNGDCYHYSYANRAEHQQRAVRYAKLGAEELAARHKRCNVFRPIGSAIIRFVTIYFVKLGFLDGYNGLIIAKVSAHASFVKYKHLRYLTKHSANNVT